MCIDFFLCHLYEEAEGAYILFRSILEATKFFTEKLPPVWSIWLIR
jgi:hypothetical protein